MSEPETFGLKHCDVPTYEHIWIQWKTSGYPRKLRREWVETGNDAAATFAIVLRYVQAWHMTDVTGAPVENTGDVACLDNVEDAVVSWLFRSFQGFWLIELPAPRPNSLPPSPAT